MGKRYVYVKKRYIFLFGVVDFIGRILFGPSRLFRNSGKPKKIRKIAVFELAHIGDVLAITPALGLLKEKFPHSHIAAVVAPWSRDILAGNPHVDEIITYRPSWFDRISKIPFSFLQAFRFTRSIRIKSFDLGFDTRGDFRSIVLMWLCGIKRRVGYGFAGGGFLLTDVVPFDIDARQDKHQIEHNINLVNFLAGKKDSSRISRDLELFLSAEECNHINDFLIDSGVKKDELLIALHPGSGLATKCWPLESYASLIEKITVKYKSEIILTGDIKERELSQRLKTLTSAKFIDAVGETSLKQLAALFKRCSLFIGGDSGAMHIACAVKTPIVAIWGGHNGVPGQKLILLSIGRLIAAPAG